MTTDGFRPLARLPASPLAAKAPLQAGRAWGDRQRALLMALVAADPGIHVLRAAHLLGLNWNTCYHHARRLAGDGTLMMAKVRGKLCLFDRKDGSVARHLARILLRDARTVGLATLLVHTPGLSQQELGLRLGITGSAVCRHMRILQASGLVERVRHGRQVHNEPTVLLHEACQALEAGAASPTLGPATEPEPVAAWTLGVAS